MSRRKSKKKTISTRPRNYVVLTMIEHCKGGSMRDRKKQADKTRCRRPVDVER